MENEVSSTNINATEETHSRSQDQNPSPDLLANWDKIIADWEASGLSQIAFCKERNIKHHRFIYFRAKRLKKMNQSKRILPIEVSRSDTVVPSIGAFILLLKSGAKLSIPQHYDESGLKKLLSLLGI